MAEITESKGTEQYFSPKIRRGAIRMLDIYEVSEAELVIMEKGSPDSIYLNFSIFLLSVALSFTIALLTTNTTSIYIFNIFVILTVIGFIVGLILFFLWYRSRNSVLDCIRSIRSRLSVSEIDQSQCDENI